MAQEKNNSPSGSDWGTRVLCSDESCIGVIGPDGRCKECGLVYEGVLPWLVEKGAPAEATENETGDVSAEDPQDAAEREPEDRGEDVGEATDEEWENRVLCSDESCIGVIGPDGRCKECGKPIQAG